MLKLVLAVAVALPPSAGFVLTKALLASAACYYGSTTTSSASSYQAFANCEWQFQFILHKLYFNVN